MAVRCVLFDLFGTLVHYDASRTNQAYPETHAHARALGLDLDYEDFLTATGQAFAELDAWSAAHQTEFSMHQFADQLFGKQGIRLTQQQSDAFVTHYTGEWSADVSAVTGVQTFLSHCAKNFQTGLITNTHHTPMVSRLLDEEAIGPFEVVTTSVDHGRPKPHRDIFLDTLSTLKLAPTEVIYVGDNYSADYLGARGAGINCYLIGRHARVPREFQIPTVLDLPLHLLR